jgi:Na+-driven multidrug efflux pump
MNLVAMAYMVAIGLETASCTIVGQEIGKGDVVKAKEYYRLFSIVTVIMISCTSLCVYIFKEQIVKLFTDKENIINISLSIIWLISFNTFPDGYKGMLKGIIKALGLQKICVYVNIGGHWCINLTLQWFFAFYLKLGLVGIWYAKLCLEAYIVVAYFAIIQCADWQKIC